MVNHYQSKEIDYLISRYGNLIDECEWHISEKIHGSNISILFTSPNDAPKIFSRNQEITGANFYNADDTINTMIEKLSPIINQFIKQTKATVRVFGELFGPGIQKGVKYGPERKIRIFDMMVNDEFQSQENMENFFYDMGIGNLLVPKLKIAATFKEAMEYDEVFQSTLFETDEKNHAEGIVIKPYKDTMVDGQGSVFYVKKKNKKFKEKQKVKKIRTETQYSEEVNTMRALFLSYINKNRVESVFSKEGEIQSYSEIGKYIPLIHKDALEDFNRDYLPHEHGGEYTETFTKAERKYIFNSSKEVVALLKEYL